MILHINPHIESYAFIKNSRLKNGILYKDEKNIIYNPAIAPYPIEQEKHYIQPINLEKHVHFDPFIESYPINTRPKFSTKKNKKKIKDSLLLYREKMRL